MTFSIRALLAAALLTPLALAGASAQARNYDCSKAGNADKAVCKGAAPAKLATPAKSAPAAASAAKPGAASTAPKAAAVRHYDCTKLGNRFRKECRSATAAPAMSSPAPVAASAAKPAIAATAKPAATAATGAGPQGATARCKDGSLSHAAHHSGACSHHGGVAQFF